MTGVNWETRLSRDYFSEFRDRGVIVAGGAAGIGAALVSGLSYLGAKVAVIDKGKADAPISIAADLAVEAERKRALNEACAKLGKVGTFVSTLGYDSRAAFDTLTQEQVEHLLRVNFIAPVFAARDVMPALRAAGGGAICLFTSRHGSEIAEPDMLGYGGAKAALDGGIRRLAARAGADNTPGNIIRVFGFCPGWVQTDSQKARFSQKEFEAAATEQLVPLGMQPEDIVPMLVFALSRHAGLLSGTTLRFDGGEGQLKGGAIEAGSRKQGEAGNQKASA